MVNFRIALNLVTFCLAVVVGSSWGFGATAANSSATPLQEFGDGPGFNPGDLVEVDRGLNKFRGQVLEILGPDSYRVQYETETATEVEQIPSFRLRLLKPGTQSRRAQASPGSRTWVTADWQHALDGEFVRRDGDQVVIRQANGELFGIALQQLSTVDQQFVAAAPPDGPAATAASPGPAAVATGEPSRTGKGTSHVSIVAVPLLPEGPPEPKGNRAADAWSLTAEQVVNVQPTIRELSLAVFRATYRGRPTVTTTTSGDLNVLVTFVADRYRKLASEIQLFDVAAQRLVTTTMEPNDATLGDISWSGKYFATVGGTGAGVTIWQYAEGQVRPVVRLSGYRFFLRIARDRWLIFDTPQQTRLRVIDLNDLTSVAEFETVPGSVATLSPAENFLAFEAPGHAAVVDLQTWEVVQQITVPAPPEDGKRFRRTFAFNFDETVLALHGSPEIELYQWRQAQLIRKFPLNDQALWPSRLAFLRDDLLLVNDKRLVDTELQRPIWNYVTSFDFRRQEQLRQRWRAIVVYRPGGPVDQAPSLQLVPLIPEQLDALRRKALNAAGSPGIPVLGTTVLDEHGATVTTN